MERGGSGRLICLLATVETGGEGGLVGSQVGVDEGVGCGGEALVVELRGVCVVFCGGVGERLG